MHEGEGGCIIMINEEQYGKNGDSEKRRMHLVPNPVRYLSRPCSSNHKDGRGAQG